MTRDIVLLNRYVALAASQNASPRAYEPGDVVAVKSPINPSTLLIKRLVALPKSIVKTRDPYPETTLRVPAGHCWIEGDEPYHSRDSNSFGPVPLGLVTSRVDWILWPPSRFGPIPNKPGWEHRVHHPPASNSTSSKSDNFFAA
ncbi:endopeptidase catalytic subunit [Sporobolomyces koalae]|uniref:endopeptidase catalytic subunit n=1 Tax=Sporobolomyces koalae TaxID=500713 RepID=UPI003176BFDF